MNIGRAKIKWNNDSTIHFILLRTIVLSKTLSNTNCVVHASYIQYKGTYAKPDFHATLIKNETKITLVTTQS